MRGSCRSESLLSESSRHCSSYCPPVILLLVALARAGPVKPVASLEIGPQIPEHNYLTHSCPCQEERPDVELNRTTSCVGAAYGRMACPAGFLVGGGCQDGLDAGSHRRDRGLGHERVGEPAPRGPGHGDWIQP